MSTRQTESADELRASLAELLDTTHRDSAVPGLGIALQVDGVRTDCSAGQLSVDNTSPFSKAARFQAGCITKLLTCLVASSLMDTGELDEEELVSEYLEELRASPAMSAVKLKHLMTHTSGYQGLSLSDPGISFYYTWEKFAAFLCSTPSLFEPGTVFNYEHSELVLLGEIIRRVTGKETSELISERILQPLGLSVGRITEDQPDIAVADHTRDPKTKQYKKLKSLPFGRFWGASLSDLTITLDALATLGSALMSNLAGERPRDVGSLTQSSTARVLKQAVRVPTTYGLGEPEELPTSFGYGAACYGGTLYGHNGSARGQTCGLRFDPTCRVSFAVGLNVWQPSLRDSLIRRVLKCVPDYADASWPGTEDPLHLPELTGRYVGPKGIDILVTAVQRGLQLSIGSEGNGQRFQISMEQDNSGAIKPYTPTMHHAVGFFLDPSSHTSCLMFGLSAFRKQSGHLQQS